jgi:DNA recombination protein RmuC
VTNEQILGISVGLAALVLLLLGYLVGSRVRARAGKPGLAPVALPPGAEALAPAFGELRAQLSELRGQIEDVRRTGAEAAGRRSQEDQAWQALARVENSLTQLSQLPTLQQSLQEQVTGAVRELSGLRERVVEERQRWALEDDAFSRLQRLTAVLLGSSTSGAAGERMVQEVLGNLPPQWVVTNHTVSGRRVEFAVRLPDGVILPIDSKVVAQSELDALDREQDDDARKRLEDGIRAQVLQRASEVRKYLDDRSAGFAVAAVPDAVYRLSGTILPRAYQEHRALLVPYSLLAPFVLMVYEQHLRMGTGDLDSQRLARLLADASNHLSQALQEVNGRLSGAITQATNARDALSRELAAAAGALEQVRTTDETPTAGRRQSKTA